MNVTTERREVEGATVAWVTVDRPDKLNALDSATTAELTEAVAGLAGDQDLRCAVLTGAGERAFIGGADVGELAALTPKTAEAFIRGLHGASRALRDLAVPVIARIHGYCLGGGMEVAAACDIRIAADDARFGMPEVALGLPSVIEAALFPSIVGAGRANWLLMTGEVIDATRACEWGFVEDVVAAADLDDAVARTAAAVVAAGPKAVRAQKRMMRSWETMPLPDAIEESIEAFVEAYKTGEPQKMMQAFLARKKKGKG
ncbi:MAG: enoyl-CoA hydratase [Rhodospirillales bacterium]